jgi:poly(beta-D-mannuronate) lyase
MARGQRALHYHLFALAPLVTMAELGTVNGEDLYSYNHSRLRLLISRSIGGLADNHYFSTKAGALQDTPEKGKIKSADVIWLTPYLRRFPDAGLNALLSRTPKEAYDYLGGLPPS